VLFSPFDEFSYLPLSLDASAYAAASVYKRSCIKSYTQRVSLAKALQFVEQKTLFAR